VTRWSGPLYSCARPAPTSEGVRGSLPPLREARWRTLRPPECLPVRQSGNVVRGGGWNNHRSAARCAYRNRNHPDNRNNNLGFRVVLCCSHVLPCAHPASSSGGAMPTAIALRHSRNAGRLLCGFADRGETGRTAPDRSGLYACRKAGRNAGHRLREADRQAGARPSRKAAVPRPAF
jgi:hypothetical protein